MGRLMLMLLFVPHMALAQFFDLLPPPPAAPPMQNIGANIDPALRPTMESLGQSLMEHDTRSRAIAEVEEHVISDQYCAMSQVEGGALAEDLLANWSSFLRERGRLASRNPRLAAEEFVELHGRLGAKHDQLVDLLVKGGGDGDITEYLAHGLTSRGILPFFEPVDVQDEALLQQAALRRELARQALSQLIQVPAGYADPELEEAQSLQLAAMSNRELMMALHGQLRKHHHILSSIDQSLRLMAMADMARLADGALLIQSRLRRP